VSAPMALFRAQRVALPYNAQKEDGVRFVPYKAV